MACQQCAVRSEDQVGAVQRGVLQAAFGDADGNVGAGLRCGIRQTVRVLAGYDHGIIVIDLPVQSAVFVTVAYGKAECETEGVAGDVALGEDDQFCAVVARFDDLLARFIDGGVLVEHDGAGLHEGDAAGIF